MRVLFISSTDDHLGGSKSLLELVQLLKDEEIEIIVVNPFHNRLNETLNKMGIENYSVGYHLNICRQNCGGVKYIVKYCAKFVRYKILQVIGIYNLKKTVDFTKVDIIHQNSSVVDIGVYFAKKYYIPLIWHLREFGDLDFNFRYFHKNIGKYISENSQRVITISKSVNDAWIEKGVVPEKMVTIIHGVNPEGINPREKQEDIIRFLFAGNIVPQKGQFDFIKAVAELKDEYKSQISLDFYGTCEDSYKDEIEKYLVENNLEHTIRLKGYSDNLKCLLKEYDVGIVNSRCEAMGRVTIEYMMAGLCVLASDQGANVELTQNGKYGILYNYGDRNSIVNNMIHIITNRKVVQSMGIAARERALREYSIVENVDKFTHLYSEVLSERDRKYGTN